MACSVSPKSSFAKLGLYAKHNKPFKIMVLGQSGVGKSALVVRFITRRFIGEYDPRLEKVYNFQTDIDNETINFEILDSAGQTNDRHYGDLQNNIRWAEAFVLMYSVSDRCSFEECHRLKFLINYNKRRRRLTASVKDSALDVPVVLVGNKVDLVGDRMVSTEEGQRRSKDIGCVCFHEISVRESIEQVWSVFRDARRFWRVSSKSPRLRSASAAVDVDLHPASFYRTLSRHSGRSTPDTSEKLSRWDESEECEEPPPRGMWRSSDSTSSSGREEEANTLGVAAASGLFRARASTDSRLPPRPTRSRHPQPPPPPPAHLSRRMSLRRNRSSSSKKRNPQTNSTSGRNLPPMRYLISTTQGPRVGDHMWSLGIDPKRVLHTEDGGLVPTISSTLF